MEDIQANIAALEVRMQLLQDKTAALSFRIATVRQSDDENPEQLNKSRSDARDIVVEVTAIREVVARQEKMLGRLRADMRAFMSDFSTRFKIGDGS